MVKGEALALLRARGALPLAEAALGGAAQLQAVARAALLALAAMQDNHNPAGPPEAAAAATAAAQLTEACDPAAAAQLLGSTGALRRALARIGGGMPPKEALAKALAEEDEREKAATVRAASDGAEDDVEEEEAEDGEVAVVLAWSAEEAEASPEREGEEVEGLVRAFAGANEAEEYVAILAAGQHEQAVAAAAAAGMTSEGGNICGILATSPPAEPHFLQPAGTAEVGEQKRVPEFGLRQPAHLQDSSAGLDSCRCTRLAWPCRLCACADKPAQFPLSSSSDLTQSALLIRYLRAGRSDAAATSPEEPFSYRHSLADSRQQVLICCFVSVTF
jgi:hypothetical protein